MDDTLWTSGLHHQHFNMQPPKHWATLLPKFPKALFGKHIILQKNYKIVYSIVLYVIQIRHPNCSKHNQRLHTERKGTQGKKLSPMHNLWKFRKWFFSLHRRKHLCIEEPYSIGHTSSALAKAHTKITRNYGKYLFFSKAHTKKTQETMNTGLNISASKLCSNTFKWGTSQILVS